MTEQEFQKTVLKLLQKLERIVFELKTDVSELKTDVSELKTEVSGLKTEVSELKTEVSRLKTDVSGLKTDVSGIRNDMLSLTDRVTTLEVCMEDQFAEQQVFAEKLAVVIENQIVDRLQAENDLFKSYTDKKVKRHEVKFRHELVA